MARMTSKQSRPKRRPPWDVHALARRHRTGRRLNRPPGSEKPASAVRRCVHVAGDKRTRHQAPTIYEDEKDELEGQ